MIGKLPEKNQRDLFRTRLEDLINPNHELVLPVNTIDRQDFEDDGKTEEEIFAVYLLPIFFTNLYLLAA